MVKIVTCRFFYRLQPASAEKLLKAFQTLDHDGKGYLTKEFLSKIMMEEGEPFTQEEMDEMMAAAIDGETGNVPYEYYINQLMVRIVPYSELCIFLS
jgi:Ca2+-binding EF-hand superfamily protein